VCCVLITGVPPASVLPVCLDVGTNNKALLEDPAYTGLKQRRLTGAAYDAVVGEFMSAVQAWRPHLMVQFEDFGNTNAFRCATTGSVFCVVLFLK
jgi:malate dehydrogenase (oxaloacetate-decarboxylating)(NADP+)